MRESFVIEAAEAGTTIAAALRRRIGELSWTRARALCERGHVAIEGVRVLDPAVRVQAGQRVEVDESRSTPTRSRLIHVDPHLVVFEKPAGMVAVPSERGERGTALDAARTEVRRREKAGKQAPLFVVHRIDRETSGLICFARSRRAERALGDLFRTHDLDRVYLAVCNGHVGARRIESRFVADRGDGLRGSTREPSAGKRAVTNLRVLETLPVATLLEVTLETGRTHQIRIHLAEAGHPIVGERVYDRDARAAGTRLLPCDRLLLHAARLGFRHPLTGARVQCESALPGDFAAALDRLRG